jgi:drug/metabolite transporter (DMT)-like permease
MVGIRVAGATSASMVSCLEPISAVVLGATVFDDPFGPAQAVGTSAVVGAVVILGSRSLQKSAAAQAEAR